MKFVKFINSGVFTQSQYNWLINKYILKTNKQVKYKEQNQQQKHGLSFSVLSEKKGFCILDLDGSNELSSILQLQLYPSHFPLLSVVLTVNTGVLHVTVSFPPNW